MGRNVNIGLSSSELLRLYTQVSKTPLGASPTATASFDPLTFGSLTSQSIYSSSPNAFISASRASFNFINNVDNIDKVKVSIPTTSSLGKSVTSTSSSLANTDASKLEIGNLSSLTASLAAGQLFKVTVTKANLDLRADFNLVSSFEVTGSGVHSTLGQFNYTLNNNVVLFVSASDNGAVGGKYVHYKVSNNSKEFRYPIWDYTNEVFY
jgi:hypothetical protein